MARPLVFAIPGSLETLTGGYIYDRRVIEGLRARGHEVSLLPLGEGFPFPDPAVLAAAGLSLARTLSDRASDPLLMVDGLALGVLPEAARQAATLGSLAALIHHPLACEHGLPAAVASQFMESETEALRHVDHVVTTSATTAALLVGDYGVEPDRILVARPGTDPVPLTERAARRKGDTLHLLSVGAVSPRKGFDLLLEALGLLTHLDWRLTIVGDVTRDPAAVAALHRQMHALTLEQRVTFTGTLSAETLDRLYAEADLFVLASYFEGYGMAYQDALAHGLPVIGTQAGAVPEVVPPEAGRLVPPGDVAALRIALADLTGDPNSMARLALGARTASVALPRWSETIDVLERLLD